MLGGEAGWTRSKAHSEGTSAIFSFPLALSTAKPQALIEEVLAGALTGADVTGSAQWVACSGYVTALEFD
jgi:hypothetical protein